MKEKLRRFCSWLQNQGWGVRIFNNIVQFSIMVSCVEEHWFNFEEQAIITLFQEYIDYIRKEHGLEHYISYRKDFDPEEYLILITSMEKVLYK